MDIAQNTQNRTRRLFQTAAKVAVATGLDVDKTEIGNVKLTIAKKGLYLHKESSIVGEYRGHDFLSPGNSNREFHGWKFAYQYLNNNFNFDRKPVRDRVPNTPVTIVNLHDKKNKLFS